MKALSESDDMVMVTEWMVLVTFVMFRAVTECERR